MGEDTGTSAETSRDRELLADLADDLETRLSKIENSLLFRLIRWPGRIATDWRGRLGQLLLHSPLHPLYLKIARPRSVDDAWQAWVEREQNALPPRDWFLYRIGQFRSRPTISVAMAVYNPRREWLEVAVESVLRQVYPHWQLCICDDASDAPWLADYLGQLAANEARVRYVRAPQRQGISGALNQACHLAAGDYVAFLDHDDVLPAHALHYVAEALQESAADLVYSDEDKLDESGRRVEPIFKPAWSPDLLLSCMYLGHLLVVRRSRLEESGPFRPETDGSQDHDLALRLSDSPLLVRHIPRVLYHWRRHQGSSAASPAAKPYAQAAGRLAIADAMRRRNIAGQVEDGPGPHTYHIDRSAAGAGLASLVICSRDPALIRRCLRSIDRNTDYTDREIVVVEHGCDLRLGDLGCKTLRYDGEFNFSAMSNIGARAATGDWIVFLNDDVVPLRRGWLTALAGHMARAEVGIAGARLLYPSGAVQHAGIVTGIMGDTGHPLRYTFGFGSSCWIWPRLTRNVSAVTGACLAIRRTLFEELGGFDEQFPVNFNDADLCLRAIEKGYRVISEPAALLRHDECRTRVPGVRWRERERWRRKWPGKSKAVDPFYSPHLAIDREDASLRVDEPMGPEDNSR